MVLGYDPANEKQTRKAEGKARIEASQNVRTVNGLINEYVARYVEGKLKKPEIIKQRLAKHIGETIGTLPVEEVKPAHIDGLLHAIVGRGYKALANNILGWLKRIFDYAIIRHYLEHNPAAAFTSADAGGQNKSRDRVLSLYVFPRRMCGNGKQAHLSEPALNLALGKLAHGVNHFVIHDLRRTMRSQLAALKIPPHICERCVNHKIKGVEGVYDRYDYLEERREALNAWANVLAGLESDRKVIPIGKQKAIKPAILSLAKVPVWRRAG